HIPVNWFSVGGSGIFGLPAVFALLILQMII
ncbi:MAG: pro-sigmaK processing inhibitor BofA family protein, partial [Clostridia bacterium]|nr:pro-sigmaK processing inhibitor BofA family protein [Clostridia bacterium]